MVSSLTSGQNLLSSNDTHILSTALHRQVRALTYPEESEMGIFFALAIPLDDPESTRSISVAFFFEANYKLPTDSEETEEKKDKRSINRRIITRKVVYTMLESKFESLGFPGRPCLLRAICETPTMSLLETNGLVGNLLNIILRPSYSAQEADLEEYIAAENSGSKNCASIYSGCSIGIYDYIAKLES